MRPARRKRPKRLTYIQKMVLSTKGINPEHWHLLQELPNSYTLKHKTTGEVKVVEK